MAILKPHERQQLYLDHRSGLTEAELTRKYKVNRHVVARWVLEGSLEEPCWEDKRRSGRPSTVSQPLKNKIRRLADQGLTSTGIRDRLLHGQSQAPSSSTIIRTLHSGRSPRFWKPVIPVAKLRRQNVEKRIAFARTHLHDDPENWVFIDAIGLTLTAAQCKNAKFSWQRLDHRRSRPQFQHGQHFHVYGAVSKLGIMPLVALEANKSITAAVFQGKVLSKVHAFYSKKVGATAGGYKLVMDNAPAHKAKSTLQFIRDHDIPWLSDFPPQAPDLNIIENAWAMLKDALDRSVLKTSRQQLLKQIETAWRKAVTPGRVNNLVRSFHNRCQLVIAKRGQLLQGY